MNRSIRTIGIILGIIEGLIGLFGLYWAITGYFTGNPFKCVAGIWIFLFFACVFINVFTGIPVFTEQPFKNSKPRSPKKDVVIKHPNNNKQIYTQMAAQARRNGDKSMENYWTGKLLERED